MNVEHNPVDFSFAFVQFFEQQEGGEDSTEKKERVNAGKTIEHGLERINIDQLKFKFIILLQNAFQNIISIGQWLLLS